MMGIIIYINGVVDAEFPMGVLGDHDLGADSFPDRADHIDHATHFLGSDGAVEWLEPLAARIGVVADIDGVGIARVEVELDGGEAFANDVASFLGVVGGIGRFAGVAVGVDTDLVAEAAAEEG